MKTYSAEIEIGGELTTLEFTTDINPIEYLWGRYGMDSYIASLTEIN